MSGLLFFICAVSATAASLPAAKLNRPRLSHTVIEIDPGASLIIPLSMAEIGMGRRKGPDDDDDDEKRTEDKKKYKHAQSKHKKKKASDSGGEKDGFGMNFAAHIFTDPKWIGILIGVDLGVYILFFGLWWLIFGGKQRSNSGRVNSDEFGGDMDPLGICTCCTSIPVLNKLESIFCSPCMLAENIEKVRHPDQRPPRAFGTFLQAILLWITGHLSAGLFPFYMAFSQRMHLLKWPYPENSSASGFIECCKLSICWPCAIAQQAEFIEVYDEYYLGKTKDGRTPQGEDLLGRSLMAKNYDKAQTGKYNSQAEAFDAQKAAYGLLSPAEKLAYSKAMNPDKAPEQIKEMMDQQEAQIKQSNEWAAMTPEQQQYYLQFQDQWAQMTEEQQVYYMQQQELWARMTPEEQQYHIQQQALDQQQGVPLLVPDSGY